MKKNIIIGVSLIGCSIFAGAAETTESEKAEINTLASEPFLSSALERFSGSVSVGYESEYMFRGYNLCSGIVSPTVNLGYDLGAGFGVYAGYWAALSVDDLSETDPFNNTVDGHYCESDFSAGITYSIENFEIDVGYIAYVYDTGGNTNEIKAAVSYDTSELFGEDFALTPYAAGYDDLTLTAKTPHKGGRVSADGVFLLCGRAPDVALPNYLRKEMFPIRYNEGKAMAFALAVVAQSDGKVCYKRNGIKVKNASFVHFYFVTHTGFKDYKSMPESDIYVVANECAAIVKNKELDYNKIYNRHISDFSTIMLREQVQVADIDESAEKIYARAKSNKADAKAVQLLYDYGKYLMLSGSRSSQPLNLQGQWNDSRRPPWSSNLTVNINFQMNYWAAAACSLDECLPPFYNAVKEISERGELTALTNFGMSGACCNHNVDIWRTTSPVKGDPQYMYSPLCGAWMACEAYRHGKKREKI